MLTKKIENSIEKKLRLELKKRGALCFKFVSPSIRGVPDRIVIFPNGVIHFIELKKEDGYLSHHQRYIIRQLTKRKVKVFVLKGKRQVEEYLAQIDQQRKES